MELDKLRMEKRKSDDRLKKMETDYKKQQDKSKKEADKQAAVCICRIIISRNYRIYKLLNSNDNYYCNYYISVSDVLYVTS